MLKHQFIQKKSNHQRQKDRKSKFYCRIVILIYLFLGGNLLQVLPALAASPPAGTVIDNQATGSFIDTVDSTEKQVESNTVKVTVAEVTGITVTSANTPGASTGAVADFDFTITNVGNDPTQFFIPDAPSAITGGTAGTLKIVAYDPDGSGPAAAVDLTGNNVSVPAGGGNTGTLLSAIASANNGSIPPGATILVRVPVTVTAAAGQTVSVTLGNTGGQPSNSNTPYILGANGTGSKDLYTVDNANGVSGESAGVPINGDATNHRQEASAAQTVTVTSVPTDYGDAPDTYGTLLASNGARHTISGLFLGAAVSPDSDGQPNATATGDTNDDGVTFSPSLGANYSTLVQAGVSNQVKVVSSGAGFVNAWIDYNQNGVFDAGELILSNQPVVAGTNTLTFTPDNRVSHGPTFARFRLSPASIGSPSPLGPILGGEVEDYQVNVAAPVPDGAACATTGLLNGSFENPGQGGSSFSQNSETTIPGWNTSATDGKIEIWSTAFRGVTAYVGNQFAEINATQVASLYQDIATVPGSTLTFQFAHRARKSPDPPDPTNNVVDSTAISIGAPGATVQQGIYNTDSTDWVVYRGTYVVPAGQFITRLEFNSISAGVGSPSVGNFIDDVNLSVNSCVPAISPPTIDLDGNNSTATGSNYQNTFTVGGAAVAAADTDVVITDEKTNITRAIFLLTNTPDGANESLTIDPTAGGTVTGVTVDLPYDSTGTSTKGRLTLKGSATLADYQKVIATLKYSNTKASPTMSDRIINVQVIDSDKASSNTAISTIKMFSTVPMISGTVFSDTDGSKIQNGTEAGTNAGGLNAVLIDSTNKVFAITAVAANGTYNFNNVPSNNYTVQITTATATVGSAPPAVILPSNWMSTGENLNGAIDGTVDSKQSVAVGTSNVPGVNFGIEQLPNTTDVTASPQNNPGTTTTVQVPTLAGTDPEDGALGSGKSFKIITLPTNATLYYNGTAATVGQVIANYDPTKLTIDPASGSITASFTYAAVDAAGQADPTPGTVTMPFTVFACTNSAADGAYATTGLRKNSIWWLNFECYDDAIAGTASGQPFSFTLPDGSTMTLTVKKTGTNPIKIINSPSWGLAAFGNSGQYGGVTGKPIFYNAASVANQDWTETLTSITVTDKVGNVRNYSFVTADGETTNPIQDGFGRQAYEQLNFATNGTGWNQVELLNMPGQSGPLGTTLTGTGTSNASWAAINNSNNGGVILSTNNPTQVAISSIMTGTPGTYTSLQGALFGIGMPKITLIKKINGRVAATDQFTTEINYTSPTVQLKTATTSGAAITSTTGPVSVLPGNVINLKETIAAGSPSSLTAYNSSIACVQNATVATTTVFPSGLGNSFNITPQLGDDITCTITNQTKPNVLLVKRITAINGDRTKNPNDNTPLNAFVDDTTSPRQADDNSPNWKSNYLLGAIDGGKVKPGDEIEYTIYFLNAGNINADNVRVCDRISPNQNFKIDAYGTSKDVQLQLGTSTVIDLTSANDSGDRAQLISAGGSFPSNCYLNVVNDNGMLVIDVTGNTGIPNLITMPGSTAQGSPNDSYGFLRFITKVKP